MLGRVDEPQPLARPARSVDLRAPPSTPWHQRSTGLPGLGQAARRGASASALNAPCAAGTESRMPGWAEYLLPGSRRRGGCASCGRALTQRAAPSAAAATQAKRPRKPCPRHAAPGQGAQRSAARTSEARTSSPLQSEMRSSGRKIRGPAGCKTRHTCLSPPRAMATVRAEALLSQERATARGASSVIGGRLTPHGPPPQEHPGRQVQLHFDRLGGGRNMGKTLANLPSG